MDSVKYKYSKEKNEYSKTGTQTAILPSPAYLPRIK